MSPKRKNNMGRGHVVFHTSTLPTFWKSSVNTEDRGVQKNASSPLWESTNTLATSWPGAATWRSASVSAGRREDKDRAYSGQTHVAQRTWLSHATLRQLQAKLEAENQEGRAIIQPLLDTEKSFVKEVERFLQQRDAAELRRKELLHKRWTEEVWIPIQSRVEEENLSHHWKTEGLRSMFMDYIQHCNNKGSVFLNSYDPTEYDPFLLSRSSSTRPRCSGAVTPALRDPLFLHSRERLKERRTALSCLAGRRFTRREVETAQSEARCRGSLRVSATTPPRVPCHAAQAAATPDGRCHRVGCWSARR